MFFSYLLLIMLLLVSSCNKTTVILKGGDAILTSSSISNEDKINEIKKAYRYFDITIDYNGLNYRVIKSKDGYYYENLRLKDYMYYDAFNNRTYSIDGNAKYEESINYDFSNIVNTIYEVLTAHITSKNLNGLLTEKTQYLNRDVTKYYRSEDDLVEETYYVDNETSACLYFCLSNGVTRVVCKVDKLEIGDKSLNEYKGYDTLEKVNLSNIKNEEQIIKNLNNFDITFSINNNIYQIISTEEGLYLKNSLGENLYISSEGTWYEISSADKTKVIADIEMSETDIKNLIINQLVSHVNLINSNFYVNKNQVYIGRGVDIYIRTLRRNGEVYKEKYYIDIETGACLNKEIANNLFIVTNYNENASLDEFINYETVERTVFNKWPSNHPYLEGIEEIPYGNFEIGYVINDELNLNYSNITFSNYQYVVSYFKNCGFNEQIAIDLPVKPNNFEMYKAKRADGMIITIQYLVNEKEMTIIIGK